MTPPLPEEKLKKIATNACDDALSSATSYVHSSTPTWNSTIINKILESLVAETSGSKDSSPPGFKFCVNSTIIQHSAPLSASNVEGKSEGGGGRRGMHSAAGAYWNNEKDGMWSFKYEGGDRLGMDVVISIMWIAI